MDDQGTRYTVRLEGGRGGTVTWFGVARLSPVPPRHVRRLDLVGDGTCLVQWDWAPGLSWWLRDSSGNWHVAMADEPRMPDDGMQAYTLDDGMQAFWLRLTPPLATIPDAAEIIVTGPATRARATVPVHPAGS